MKIPITLIVVCLWLCQQPILATPNWDTQDTLKQVYKGKIDLKYSITVELCILEEQCWGRFYYDKYIKDIEFVGDYKDQVLTLHEINAKTGAKSKGAFIGNLSDDLLQIKGHWQNTDAGKSMPFELNALSVTIPTNTHLNYDKVKDFQSLLNYFDLQPKLPLKIDAGLNYMDWHWTDWQEEHKKDFKHFIPYAMANQYIMNQVNFGTEGSLNYFDIAEKNYKEYKMGYRSIGYLSKNYKFVSLLFHFDADTGWDDYEVFFVLNFDYEGRLLGGFKAFTHIVLERTGQFISEQTHATFLQESTIDLSSERITIEYGTNHKTGEEYYNEKNSKTSSRYTLQEDGSFAEKQLK
ncbi:MAG: hypothetical protein GY810_21485 [Aureispira sp.]|nr:hypothetical protein [Aureispira sp.]